MITDHEYRAFTREVVAFERSLRWYHRLINWAMWKLFWRAFCPRCGKRWAKYDYTKQYIPVGEPLSEREKRILVTKGIALKDSRMVDEVERVLCECGLGMSKREGRLYDVFVKDV